MNLETTFYSLGILFMTLMIVIMIALIVAVFYIKNKITEIHSDVNRKIAAFREPAEVALEMGSAAIDTVKNLTRKKK